MIKLIKNVKIFNPQTAEPKDILIADKKIVAVEETDQIKLQGLEYETIDGRGLMAVPGFVDPHVHILGGGGEGGPATRAPEIRIENCLSCGVTSVIGCLGTDSITRHMSSLLAKARALEIEGLSTWIFTGAYNLPTPTITGSVRSDLALIDKIIGAGEIALSDHRSSQPTFEEFLHLVAECRVGGLLGDKAGVAHFHLGNGQRGLEYLFRMAKETEIPVTQVIPTHITRCRALFDQGLEWLKLGGVIDLTAGLEPIDESEVSVIGALEQIKSLGLPLSRVTISSDSNGSLPVFGDQGSLVGLTIANQEAFIQIFQEVVRKNILSLEEASELFSSNAASFYKLPGKGKILTSYDADLLLFDESLELKEVFSQGKWLVQNGVVKAKGTFNV